MHQSATSGNDGRRERERDKYPGDESEIVQQRGDELDLDFCGMEAQGVKKIERKTLNNSIGARTGLLILSRSTDCALTIRTKNKERNRSMHFSR